MPGDRGQVPGIREQKTTLSMCRGGPLWPPKFAVGRHAPARTYATPLAIGRGVFYLFPDRAESDRQPAVDAAPIMVEFDADFHELSAIGGERKQIALVVNLR